MRSFTISAVALLATVMMSSSAQLPSGETDAHHFSAQWITGRDIPAHGPAVLHLRKEFELGSVPAHFVVHVSADEQFLLYVNGQRIGQGPAIGDVQHWRYETFDLSGALHPGRNVLAATVWNAGDQTPVRQMSSELGFLMDPDSAAEAVVATDSTWKVHADAGVRFLPKPAELANEYYVGSPGERLDGRTFDWSWSDPAALAMGSLWSEAVTLGTAVARGNNSESNAWLLVPDRLPAMEYRPMPAGRVVRVSGIAQGTRFPGAAAEIPAHTHATLLLDGGVLTTAYPALTVSGGAGSHVRATYAEALVDAQGNKGNRNEIEAKHIVGVYDEFLPDGANGRTFAPLDWRTWRFLELDITTSDQPLRLDALTTSFTAFPFEHRARFASDDPALTDIWNVGWRTARLCAHDAYMDTPYWERLQYVGDTRIQTLISYTNAGDDRLAREAIEAFHDSLLPEGIGQSRYPSRHLQVIQNFSLLWIGMVHDFWYFRNDPAFVRQQLPAIRSELSYFRERRTAQGFPSLRDWWPFVDWAKGFPGGDSPSTLDGVSAAGSLFYLEALRNAAELERGLGDSHLGQEDSDEADHLQRAILQHFWSEKDGLIADTPELAHFSQQANALAVWLDVIPREQQTALMERIYSATDPGFHASRPLPNEFSVASNYFRFYLTRALLHAGLGNRYLDTVGPWKTMLSNGLTTWAEQPEPTRSDSHAWSAHPNIDLLTTVAGILPAGPNFSAVQIAPALGPLHHLSVSYPSPRGEIDAEYTVTAEGVSAAIQLPPDLQGVLHWNHARYPLHPGTQHLNLPPLSREP